jgi:hypothetical protein
MANTVTLWHYYEEVLHLPYVGHYLPARRHLNHCVPGRRLQYEYPGIAQEVLRGCGILRTGPVGKSTSGVMEARRFDSFMAKAFADDPYCLVLRPPDSRCGDLVVDALHKAARMAYAWRQVAPPATRTWELPYQPVPIPAPGSVVREDCPAFAGWHNADGHRTPLCSANDRHPDLFRHGGVFNLAGVTTCATCVWNRRFPATAEPLNQSS